MDIKIALQIMQSAPPPTQESSKKKVDVLTKVKDFIQEIEGGMGHDCYQWNYLKAMFLALHHKKTLSELEKDLLSLLEPTIMKYVEFDPELAPKIEGYQLNKYKDRENA